MKPLEGRVALVAGATRGAGRGIARMLGEAGAIVYCTGRSAGGSRPAAGPYAGRSETVEQTAEMVNSAGGKAIPLRVDHRMPSEVGELLARIRRDENRLDLLVNVFWGGPSVEQWGSFWTHPLEEARALFDAAWPHVLTSREAAALMVERGSGLIVQLTEGEKLYYRMNLYYDLARCAEARLAFALAEELAASGVTALALSPGYLRSESTLDLYGVTESSWREAVARDPNFAASETPCFVGRAVVALASDPDVARKAGGLYSSWGLSEEYGFTDLDGSRPNFGRHLAQTGGDSPFGPPRTSVRWKIEDSAGGSTGPSRRRRKISR